MAKGSLDGFIDLCGGLYTAKNLNEYSNKEVPTSTKFNTMVNIVNEHSISLMRCLNTSKGYATLINTYEGKIPQMSNNTLTWVDNSNFTCAVYDYPKNYVGVWATNYNSAATNKPSGSPENNVYVYYENEEILDGIGKNMTGAVTPGSYSSGVYLIVVFRKSSVTADEINHAVVLVDPKVLMDVSSELAQLDLKVGELEEDISLDTITTTISELSGLCFKDGVLYGISDEGGVYTINQKTGESTLVVNTNKDLEGITTDGTDLYICTEETTNEILKVSGTTVSVYGTVTGVQTTSNKGMEGIAYYDSVSNEPRFLIGNQDAPKVLLWSASAGTIASCNVDKGADQISDLHFDGTYLWIVDANKSKVYRYTIAISGTSIALELVDTKDFSDTIAKSEAAEAVCVVGDTIYVGCDQSSKVYKFKNYLTDSSVAKKYTDDELDKKLDWKKNIPAPTRLIRIDVTLNEGQTLPTTKNETTPILAYGKVKVNFDGITLNKYCTLEVQGASSQQYEKKNYKIGFFSDEECSNSYKFRLNNMVAHDEYIYKANYIDVTHARNIACNRIWDEMVMSRKSNPKREIDYAWDEEETAITKRFETGALGHSDGFPCVFYVDGEFYGIGSFMIGKKVVNYNLDKKKQTQILMSGETHCDFYNYVASEWEIKNPKTPDSNYATRVKPWFDANKLTGDAFKTQLGQTHDMVNAIDYYLLLQGLCIIDDCDKNFLLMSKDGQKFYFMPYDLDSSLGLHWNGGKIFDYNKDVFIADRPSRHEGYLSESSEEFWHKFETAFASEINARYKELRDNGIFTVENVYSKIVALNKLYGDDLYALEFAKWTNIPSNCETNNNPFNAWTDGKGCYASVEQIPEWYKQRLEYLDGRFGYSEVVTPSSDDMQTSNTLSDGLVDNTKYTLGEISSLDIKNVPSTNTKGIIIYFTASASGCTLDYDDSLYWLGGEPLTIEASKNYAILIADGICSISEYAQYPKE